MAAPCPTLGFFVSMEVNPSVDSNAWTALWDDWIDMLEGRGLRCGGGGSERHEYAITGDASQATEQDRIAVEAWLTQHPNVTAWNVGPLHDLADIM